MDYAPDLPTRFPCWCRAIYSWGGESNTDLGFVEGDLIECLNAGDGSWWMGRLRRDKRVMGMFPSNFVTVLGDDFRPASRASSPLPDRSRSPNPQQTPQKSKSKPFRKPFQAYAAPDTAAQKRAEVRKQESISVSRTPSPAPPRFNNNEYENVSSHSPSRYPGYVSSRAPSPNPYVERMRAPSPSFPPSPSRAASIIDTFNDEGIFSNDAEHGSPPPPPPPHRTNFRAQTSTGFQEHRDGYSNGFQRPRSITPDPHIPERTGHTPSPLTHAMNDVISSLEDMGVTQQCSALSQHDVPSQQNIDPWTPAAFNLQQAHERTPTQLRPNTSTGVDHEYEHSKNRPNHQRSRTDFSEEPPQLSNYVERMESRLGRTKPTGTPRSSDQGSAYQMPPRSSNQGSAYQMPPRSSGQGSESEYQVPPHSSGQGSQYQMPPPEVPPKQSFFRSKSPFSRPKSPFSRPKSPFGRPKSPFGRSKSPFGRSDSPPAMPPPNHPRSKSSMGDHGPPPVLRHRKSAYEVGKSIIGRTFTHKSSSTTTSSGVQSTTTNGTSSTGQTDKSLMSGKSAGAYSATSAGEYARKYSRAQSAMGTRENEFDGVRPETPFTGVTYHSSHASGPPRAKSQAGWRDDVPEVPEMKTPKGKKSGFFKRMVESAKFGAANARSSVGNTSPSKSSTPTGIGNFGIQYANVSEAAKDNGLGTDWVQVRRDVNRSNSLSRREREERETRCQMLDLQAIDPIAELYEATNGDQDGNGGAVAEPTNFQVTALALVDKNARFINELRTSTNPISLAHEFVCRPYKTDVQRLRAIFTWVAEKIIWEEDFEGDVDTTRVVQTRRGATEEVVFLVLEMCQAVKIPCNVIRGYLKTPGEVIENGRIPHPNHFWNSVLIDNEWRIMDCSLASPSHPKRSQYSSASSDKAESWYFLTRPMQICWTHVPCHHQDQHLAPYVMPDILLSLPCACPPFFKNMLEMVDFNTAHVRIDALEIVHIQFSVPADVECIAEVEALALARDADGDVYETDIVARKPALCQALWFGSQKHYKVKALLPPNSGSQGVLKIYAGKRGLYNSINHNPHPMAFALPIIHTGTGSDGYEFLLRYPVVHASRHDLYVIQPQCKRLVLGNTFVFAVRQHPAALELTEEAVSEASGAPSGSRDGGRSPIPGLGSRDGNRSPIPFLRPGSAMSVTNSNSASGNGSNALPEGMKKFKTAKLALQSPGGKILRMQKKDTRMGSSAGGGNRNDGAVDLPPDGGIYETIIKCGERGLWRALVLADRTARWCVFAEWECV